MLEIDLARASDQKISLEQQVNWHYYILLYIMLFIYIAL